MWEEMKRSPALAAPGSNDFAGLIASSTAQRIGREGDRFQGLSEKEADRLCKDYKPLVLNRASRQSGKGIDFDELVAAGQLGLARALQKFDPDHGSFGAYAKHWINGEITALFKQRVREPAAYAKSLNEPALSAEASDGNLPDVSPDLRCLTPKRTPRR
jgi:DNA-directed RNA polymerase specialized sigma subunit